MGGENAETLTVALITVCGTLLLFGLYRCFRYYKDKQRKLVRVHLANADRGGGGGGVRGEGARSIKGNFVKQHTEKNPITDSYEVTETLLGRGSSAHVVIGVNKRTHRRYAIKIIDASRKEVAWRYDREMNMLKDVDHTNIVRLFEVYTTPTARFFVMELCTGGHLGQVLKDKPDKRLEESIARQYIVQLVRAIVHCHKRGICHRDIKLQNILLESNSKDAQVKLVDFGNGCSYVGKTPMRKIVGTTYTAAPEVFKECYDERCDVWSIGVVAYILLSGRRPFESLELPGSTKSKESSVIANILLGRYHFLHEVWEDVTSASIHFIQCCLELDYTKRRPSTALLNHPWITHSDLHHNIGAGISPSGARSLSRRFSRNLSSSGMRRTSMLAVAFAMPSQKVQALRTLFQQIDKNGSGVVERNDFQIAMQSVNPNMSAEDVDVLFDTIDQDGNKQISFIEFVAATIDPREVDVSELNNAFRLLDKEGKGYITQDDLRRVLAVTNEADDDDASGEEEGPATADAHSSSAAASVGSGGGVGGVGGVGGDVGSKTPFEKEERKRERRASKLNQRIMQIIEQADLNNDGVISHTEFLFAMADGSLQVQLQTQKLVEAATKNTISPDPDLIAMRQDSFSSDDKGKLQSKRSRRQSDSILNLSGTTFRQRASSIFFRKSTASAAATAAATATTTTASESTATLAATGTAASSSLLTGVGSYAATTATTESFKERVVPPSITSLVVNDVRKTITTIFGSDSQDMALQLRGKSGNAVSYVDDSPEEDEDSESDDSEEDIASGMHSRRMSSPASFLAAIVRRASVSLNRVGRVAGVGVGGGAEGGAAGAAAGAGEDATAEKRRSSMSRRRSSAARHGMAGGDGGVDLEAGGGGGGGGEKRRSSTSRRRSSAVRHMPGSSDISAARRGSEAVSTALAEASAEVEKMMGMGGAGGASSTTRAPSLGAGGGSLSRAASLRNMAESTFVEVDEENDVEDAGSYFPDIGGDDDFKDFQRVGDDELLLGTSTSPPSSRRLQGPGQGQGQQQDQEDGAEPETLGRSLCTGGGGGRASPVQSSTASKVVLGAHITSKAPFAVSSAASATSSSSSSSSSSSNSQHQASDDVAAAVADSSIEEATGAGAGVDSGSAAVAAATAAATVATAAAATAGGADRGVKIVVNRRSTPPPVKIIKKGSGSQSPKSSFKKFLQRAGGSGDGSSSNHSGGGEDSFSPSLGEGEGSSLSDSDHLTELVAFLRAQNAELDVAAAAAAVEAAAEGAEVPASMTTILEEPTQGGILRSLHAAFVAGMSASRGSSIIKNQGDEVKQKPRRMSHS